MDGNVFRIHQGRFVSVRASTFALVECIPAFERERERERGRLRENEYRKLEKM